MDDFKIWFYVIVGIIYVVSRVLKKKPDAQPKPTSVPRPTQRTRQGNEPLPTKTSEDRPMSFEELLKEITEAKKELTPPQPMASKPVYEPPTYVDYDDDIPEETDTKTFEAYEKAKSEAFERPSLEESNKQLEAMIGGGERFDQFALKKKGVLLREYKNELRSPKGFKRAIVLSEILNRRF